MVLVIEANRYDLPRDHRGEEADLFEPPRDTGRLDAVERLSRDLPDRSALRVGQSVAHPALIFEPRDPHFPIPRTSAMS